MVPPPRAVMQPSMHTPTQSMLRFPAASAAVIACAASATSDSACRTISLGNKPDIKKLLEPERNLRRGFPAEQAETWQAGGFAALKDVSNQEPPSHPAVVMGTNGGTHSWLMNAIRTIPIVPLMIPIVPISPTTTSVARLASTANYRPILNSPRVRPAAARSRC